MDPISLLQPVLAGALGLAAGPLAEAVTAWALSGLGDGSDSDAPSDSRERADSWEPARPAPDMVAPAAAATAAEPNGTAAGPSTDRDSLATAPATAAPSAPAERPPTDLEPAPTKDDLPPAPRPSGTAVSGGSPPRPAGSVQARGSLPAMRRASATRRPWERRRPVVDGVRIWLEGGGATPPGPPPFPTPFRADGSDRALTMRTAHDPQGSRRAAPAPSRDASPSGTPRKTPAGTPHKASPVDTPREVAPVDTPRVVSLADAPRDTGAVDSPGATDPADPPRGPELAAASHGASPTDSGDPTNLTSPSDPPREAALPVPSPPLPPIPAADQELEVSAAVADSEPDRDAPPTIPPPAPAAGRQPHPVDQPAAPDSAPLTAHPERQETDGAAAAPDQPRNPRRRRRLPDRWPMGVALCGLWSLLADQLSADHPWAIPGYFTIAFACVVLATTDLRTGLLPNRVTYPAFASTVLLLGGAALITGEPERLTRSLAAALAAGILFLLLARFAGMGLGDVKCAPTLAAALGWLSWPAVANGAILAFMLAGVAAVVAMTVLKWGRKAALPLGPWLAAGALLSILTAHS